MTVISSITVTTNFTLLVSLRSVYIKRLPFFNDRTFVRKVVVLRNFGSIAFAFAIFQYLNCFDVEKMQWLPYSVTSSELLEIKDFVYLNVWIYCKYRIDLNLSLHLILSNLILFVSYK